MTVKVVFFDFGGVLVRTEFQAPRLHLAERLGLSYEEMVRAVFNTETARQATLGAITEEAHWAATLKALHLPASGSENLTREFFGGDVVDQALVTYARSLRPRFKVGLISNAWSGLRAYITRQGFADIFDQMIISSEVGVAKPDPAIFHLALDKFGIQPQEAAFVDDFIENIEGARAVGMTAIYFQQPAKALEELKSVLNSPE